MLNGSGVVKQVLTLLARVDLGAMAIKEYSVFPKAPALLEPCYQIVSCYIQGTRWAVLPLCSDAVGVFYSPSRLDHRTLDEGVYLSAEMQSVYSTAPVDWTTGHSMKEYTPSAEMQLLHFVAPSDWIT